MQIRYFALIFVVFLPFWGQSQDLHFSQFYLHPQHLNPALNGVFQGEWRAGAHYRQQWTAVPVIYRTAGAWIDRKIFNKGANMFSAGLLLQNDQAGDATLSWNQAGLGISASHALGGAQALSAGFGISMAQRSVDLSGIKFPNQWDDNYYDPARPSREPLGQNSGLTPSLQAGLNWHFEPGIVTRTRMDAGLSASHLNRVRVNFADDEDFFLPRRWVAYYQGFIQVHPQMDVVAHALWQGMGTNRETLTGAGVRYAMGDRELVTTAVTLSLTARWGDALIPALQIEQGPMTFGVSYDINVSGFDVATQKRGGIEVALTYRSLPAKPPATFKTCPIF